MANESLYIPEEYLQDVINVIRKGLSRVKLPENARRYLLLWCEAEEAYLKEDKDDTL